MSFFWEEKGKCVPTPGKLVLEEFSSLHLTVLADDITPDNRRKQKEIKILISYYLQRWILHAGAVLAQKF